MDGKSLIFTLSLFMMTLSLCWGLRLIIHELTASGAGGRSLIGDALTEKSGGVTPPSEAPLPGSFSRIAGAFGMMGLSAAVIGMSYWLIYALFYDAASLTRLGDAGAYFLAGGALFTPYAVNRLAGVFRLGG